MDTIPGIADLRQRREALLLESELNRQALRLEIVRIGSSFNQLRHGLTTGRGVWKWVAPLAGFLIAKKLGNVGTVAKGSVVVGLARALWKNWRDRHPPAS